MPQESFADRGLNIALNGAVQLIQWELDNRCSVNEYHGLKRAIEIIQELHKRLQEKE